MFVTSAEYKKVVTSIAEEEGELLVAVAFWGEGAESIVDSRPGGSVKIICNLKSGATNPTIIEALRNKNGICLKQHDRLHAKVVAGSKTAVVGSANFSSNGLNLEGEESEGWEEAGFVVENPAQIYNIKKWFQIMWDDDADEIGDQDIENAKEEWRKRRKSRITTNPNAPDGFTLDCFTRAQLSDRSIYVVMHNMHDEKFSPEAQAEAQNSGVLIENCYEGCPELPRGAQFIDLHRGPLSGLEYIGVYTWIDEREFPYKGGAEGHLTVCREENRIMGLRFRRKEGKRLVKNLRPHKKPIWDNALACCGEVGRYISLADVVDICSQH